jgi:hypothetical protein
MNKVLGQEVLRDFHLTIKMNKKAVILSAIFFIFCIQFIIADVSVKNASIGTQYAPNAAVTGWINLNLADISSNAYIKTGSGQNISLIDLIKKQSGFNYSCTTSDCNSSYSVSGSGADSKQLSLSSGESQIFGFVISGTAPVVQQATFSLNITSDAALSNFPQLFIDLLNDNSPDWNSYLSSGTFTGQNFGCYSTNSYESQGSLTSYIGSTQYCETISFEVSPQVSIGAYISGSGVSTMQMSIRDKNSAYAAGTCTIQTSGSGEISCIPKVNNQNYSIKNSGDFFVCIKQTSGTSNSYQINRESTSPCGFVGDYLGAYTVDYRIFGKSGQFAPLGNFLLNDTSVANAGYSGNLESKISGYLFGKYGNNCTKECVIPISLNAKQTQSINLDNFRLLVNDPLTVGTYESTLLYDLEKTFALINTAGYQTLSLNNANISVPGEFGNHTFVLTLIDGNKSYALLSKKINVEKIPQIVSVIPATAAGALPTEFTANINTFGSNATVIQYKWDFGDGSAVQTTTAKTISHTYNQLGTFNLKITIINSQGFSSAAEFSISVVSPKDAVNEILNQNLENAASIETQLGIYPKFAQDAMKQTLNLDSAKTKLQDLQASSSIATTDEQYLAIMKELVQINLPDRIEQTYNAPSAPFFPIGENINLDALKTIGGGDYESARGNEYINSIVLWNLNNVKLTTIDYSEFSGIYGETVTPLLDIVKLNIGGVATGNAYLIIPKMDNIYLDKNYSQSGDYYYVPLSGNSQTVQFATSESLSPINLPVFIAPSLNQISLPEQESAGNRMLIFGIVMGSVILAGIIAYILVGKWYQRKYESYLFKDRNDLYNIINYIHKSKSKDVKEDEIEKNLRKAKWNSEQIKYVMKRYAGKRIGIPGFLRKSRTQ